MKNIVIISSSVRQGRSSHRIALFFEKFIQKQEACEITILDLKAYDFPLFPERLRFLEHADAKTLEFADYIKNADGILIVTPEYNGAYPASLKNVMDLLFDEWKRKPIAIATVSAGNFGGAQVITSLVFTFWKIGALVIPSHFSVPNVTKEYTEEGETLHPEVAEKRASSFITEFFHWIGRISSN